MAPYCICEALLPLCRSGKCLRTCMNSCYSADPCRSICDLHMIFAGIGTIIDTPLVRRLLLPDKRGIQEASAITPCHQSPWSKRARKWIHYRATPATLVVAAAANEAGEVRVLARIRTPSVTTLVCGRHIGNNDTRKWSTATAAFLLSHTHETYCRSARHVLSWPVMPRARNYRSLLAVIQLG